MVARLLTRSEDMQSTGSERGKRKDGCGTAGQQSIGAAARTAIRLELLKRGLSLRDLARAIGCPLHSVRKCVLRGDGNNLNASARIEFELGFSIWNSPAFCEAYRKLRLALGKDPLTLGCRSLEILAVEVGVWDWYRHRNRIALILRLGDRVRRGKLVKLRDAPGPGKPGRPRKSSQCAESH